MVNVLLKDKVYSFVKAKGLVIPLDVKRAFNTDLLISSAILSELVSDGRLKTTWLKFGSTPFYYPPERPEILISLRKYLNEKDKQVFDLLQSKKLLKDSELTPLQRIALRNLKDFAIPLTISNPNNPNEKQVWWRWFLFSEEQALSIINEVHKKSKQQVLLQHPIQSPQRMEKTIQKQALNQIIRQDKAQEHKSFGLIKKPVDIHQKTGKSERSKRFSKQELLMIANTYFKKKNIKPVDVLKTSNSQADFIIEVPSSIGRVKVYCRFKAKKRITDNDLASLFVASNSKNMPALLITNGSLTNKAKTMLNKEFQNLKVETKNFS